jgi:hypothetical protein
MVGGQINLFLSALPTFGAGKLQMRDDPTIYNTDKERNLFTVGHPYWRILAEELAETGVGVNAFLFPDQYTDVATMSTLSATTGGEVFLYGTAICYTTKSNASQSVKLSTTQLSESAAPTASVLPITLVISISDL